jgi:hypothetical protein
MAVNIGFWINLFSIIFIIIALFMVIGTTNAKKYFMIPAGLGFVLLVIGSIICFQRTFLLY